MKEVWFALGLTVFAGLATGIHRVEKVRRGSRRGQAVPLK